jgi:putative membrane protein
MRLLQRALLLLSVGLFVALVLRNDPAAVLASMAHLSWRVLVILCIPAIPVALLDTLGWHFAFTRERPPFGTLVTARLAGEAFNLTTPTAALGGEAVKAWLLRGRVRADVSVSSVIIAKTTITIAQALFLLAGLLAATRLAVPESRLFSAMPWVLIAETLAIGVFVLAQSRGLLGWAGRLLGQLGVNPVRDPAAVARIDARLSHFYRREPVRLLLSTGCCLVAWLLGVLEVWMVLRFLGIEVSLMTATVIEAFAAAVKFAVFFIPAGLGAVEGGYLATFAALGLSPAAALSLSLTRRIREAVWSGIGLLTFALMRLPGAGGSAGSTVGATESPSAGDVEAPLSGEDRRPVCRR